MVYKIIIMNIGDKIKHFRMAKELSQKEVATRIGIDQAQYSRIESGKVEPTLSSIQKIADALHIDIAELFSKEQIADINSYDKNVVERLHLLDQLEEVERKSIFNIIDMAISKKRLKDTLTQALSINL